VYINKDGEKKGDDVSHSLLAYRQCHKQHLYSTSDMSIESDS